MRERIVIGLLVLLLIVIPACERNPARERLARMNVKYSKHEFLRRIEDSDRSVVDLFLAAGMNPDTKDKEGATALMYAARKGHIDMVRLLVEHGADVNAKNKYDGTALMYALGDLSNSSGGGRAEIVRFLVERGANVNAQARCRTGMPGKTALIYAARKGNLELVRLLVENGADVNAQAEYRRTALIEAVQYAPADVVQYLLEHGADPNVEMEAVGGTALTLAEHMNRPEVVKLLKEAGAKAGT